MTINVHGGGAQTNINGLQFEQDTSLDQALRALDFTVENYEVYLGTRKIGYSVQKNKLYSVFLEPRGVSWKEVLTRKLLPDDALIIEQPFYKEVIIIEKKFQSSHGSVDEKLQTCEFKRLQYQKLFHSLDFKVRYVYVLKGDWFRQHIYDDVLQFIRDRGCEYYFDEIPISNIIDFDRIL